MAVHRRFISLILLLFVLSAVLAGIVLRSYRQSIPSTVPVAAATRNMTGRVVIVPAQLGEYGSYGETGKPAWELRREPELVKQYGGDNDSVLLLRCDCGKVIRMLDHHVAEDGTVSPSIWHDTPECGWHVYGRLEGWTNGEWSVTSTPAPAPVASAKGEKSRENYGIPGRITVPKGSLGEFMSMGPAGSPAWELRNDPELAARLRLDNDDVLLLRCECGQILRFGDHKVNAEGIVNPSMWHDVPECGWHVFCSLEGWEAGEWKVRTLPKH